MGDVTALLRAASKGSSSAAEKLLPLIYSDLRMLARSALSRERPNHTLRPTAIVHEAYLRIFQSSNQKGSQLTFEERGQFFGLASKVMRQLLVDYARRKHAEKRGGGLAAEVLPDTIPALPHPPEEILAIHEGLDRLHQLDERQATMIEMHYFGGLDLDEIALSFSVSTRTVKRELCTGRLFLKRHLSSTPNSARMS